MLGTTLGSQFLLAEGGDFYAMNLAPEAQGEMIAFYMYEEAPSVEYNSLESMLKNFLTNVYNEGIIF